VYQEVCERYRSNDRNDRARVAPRSDKYEGSKDRDSQGEQKVIRCNRYQDRMPICHPHEEECARYLQHDGHGDGKPQPCCTRQPIVSWSPSQVMLQPEISMPAMTARAAIEVLTEVGPANSIRSQVSVPDSPGSTWAILGA
jgi:hypothetical protein